MKENNFKLLAQNTAGTNGGSVSIVTCGNDGVVENACTIDDLVGLADNIGNYVISVIFPAVFFIGLLFTIYPILKDPTNPQNLKESKGRGLKLLIGSAFMLGAYLLVKAVLSSIGVKNPNLIKGTVGIQDFLVTHSYAAGNAFSNPLDDVSIQNIILGIVNILTFAAFIGIVLGLVRGVMLLMLGQQNPEYIKKGKQWIIYTLLVAAIVFGAEMLYNIINTTVTGVLN